MKIPGKTLFIELIGEIGDRGYPGEYLLSRLRGRSAYLITDWEPFISGTEPLDNLPSPLWKVSLMDKSREGLWRHLMKEYRWVYVQMNEGLRELFRPFFLYAELRTLFPCLRYKEAAEKGKIEEVLSLSLLSERIKEILKGTDSLHAALEGIEGLLSSFSGNFRGLRSKGEREGLRGAEQWLMMRFLEYTINSGLHPVIRNFFVRLIDSRNILLLSKYLRWGLKAGPVFTRGGSISGNKLSGIMRNADPIEVASLIRRLTGMQIEKLNPAHVRHTLSIWITKSLMRAGRGGSFAEFVLYYLWRCSLEVENLGILIYGKDIGREEIETELVS